MFKFGYDVFVYTQVAKPDIWPQCSFMSSPTLSSQYLFEISFLEEQNELWNLDYQPETLLMVKQDPESFCMECIALLAFPKKNMPTQQMSMMTAKFTKDF